MGREAGMVSYGWKTFVGELFIDAIRLAKLSTPGASESAPTGAHLMSHASAFYGNLVEEERSLRCLVHPR